MRVLLGILVAIAAILVGAYFFLSVPEIPRATLEAKYATPPSQFLALKDVPRVHYRDQGPRNAPVLVLVHGSNASLFTWEPWVARLGDTFRVVTIDMPSHGLTGAANDNDCYSNKGMAEFVNAVADKIGLKKFAIGGNSMGGGVAARFAEDYPDRVTALILVDAGGMPAKAGDNVPIGFRIARIPVLNKLMEHMTPRAIFADGLHKSFNHENLVTPATIDEYWELNRMAGTPAATMARFQIPFDTYIKDHASQIKAPTLILWGAKDHLIPVAAASEYQQAIPGSKLIVYPDGGHVLQEDEADKSAADAKAFLTSVHS
jgi:pimeloyl-ACP methyl ester carboxylesterase